MSFRPALLALAIVAGSSLTGCATLAAAFGVGNPEVNVNVQGTHENVEVDVLAMQSGAKSTYTGHDRIKLKLQKDQDYRLTVKAPGFEAEDIVVSRKYNMVAVADASCLVVMAAMGGINGASIGKQLPSSIASAVAPLGAAAGLCTSGCCGCCLSGFGYAIDSASNNTSRFDSDVNVMLRPARRTSSGEMVLPIGVFDNYNHGVAVEAHAIKS